MHELEIKKIRTETPGCYNVCHFNNAGASLMAEPTLQAVITYLEEEAAFGGYETATKRENDLLEVYHSIAQLIHAKPEEIAILENATAAWNMAFYSIPFSDGDRILTSVSEYASNYLNYLNLKKTRDITIEVIPNDRYGQVSIEALYDMMDPKVKLISITHIPTNNGLVNPAEDIGEIAKQYDCYYLLDACQSAGQYPLDVGKLGCDFLSATGRKYLRAPRGTGFLYVNNDILDELHPPFLDLHAAEWTAKDSFQLRGDTKRFENWEANYAGIMGLHTAVDYLLDLGIQPVWQRIQFMGKKMRDELSKISSVKLHDMGKVRSGIVTFSVQGYLCSEVKKHLVKRDINVSISSKSSTFIDMEQRNLDKVVRASLHYYNTETEIDRFISALKDL